MAQERPPPAAGDAPPVAVPTVAWSARLRNAGRTVRGTAAGLASVLRLSWRVSPLLTAGLGVVTVVIGLVPALTTYLTSLLINAVAVAIPGGPAAADSTGRIWLLVGLQFLVFAANAVAGAVYGIVGRLLEERVGLRVQLQIMGKASELDLAFFEDSASYDLLREAQQEASSRPASMVSGAFGQLQVAITFASMIVLLVGLSPVLAVVAMLAPVPAFLADSRFGRRMFAFARWSSPVRRRMQYLTSLVTADTAAKEVKLFGLGAFFVGQFGTLGHTLYRRQRDLVVARNLSYAGWGLITTVVTSVTYLYVALQAIQGRLTVGDIVLFSSALTAAQAAVQSLFRGITTMYEDNLYLERLRDLLAVPTATAPGGAGLPLPSPLRGHVVFEHVSFRYPGTEALALDDVSLEILPGQTLAVVGRNGAGKSTLVKLLCRLYDPLSGRILLDGVDIRELDCVELRSLIGGMFQDYVAYQATAAENIGYGDLDRLADRDAVTACARLGGAAGVIEKLPDGYDSQLGKWFEHGSELSGGEWQKVALSRAFMRDARIMVLDEPTSALDAQAEFELFDRLRALTEGRTTIYISHRFSTVRNADRVLLLRNGRIAEYGSHEDLMACDGEYTRLFTMQAFAYVDLPVPAHHAEKGD
jgi:ATP-binding cassette subfamily B protein